MKRHWRIVVIALSAAFSVGVLAIGISISGTGDSSILTRIQRGEVLPSLAYFVQWVWPADDLYREVGRGRLALLPGNDVTMDVVHQYVGLHTLSVMCPDPQREHREEWPDVVLAVALDGGKREEVAMEPPQAGYYGDCEERGMLFYWYSVDRDDVGEVMKILVGVVVAGRMSGTDVDVVVNKAQNY